ncbi:TPA: hypothetical protein PFE14_004348 [Kluyvera ascorbata]|nr:hypothetical protein [Kluyvera ascorbata]
MTDLHVAMSLNPELQAMVEQYIVDPLNSQALLQDIIFTWAGVADIAADSRGENIDTRQLSVLEKATGENYQNKVNGTTDPLKNAAVLLEDEYKRFSDFIEASLLSQTLYRDDFATISLTMKSDYSGLTLNFDDLASHLESIKLTDVNEYLHLRKTFYALFEYSPSYSDVREQLGIPSEQSFFGDDGNNTFSGSKMNDYIWGNKGDDTLKGGYGSDTYLFNMGDGKDYISEGSSNAGDIDTLRFGEGINPEDVILQRKITTGLKAADSLIITFRDSTDSITIDNFFSGTKYQVEAFIFTDGTVWHVDTIKARLLEGADDAQTITAYAEGSEIHAAGGNDSLQGADNSDQLYGDAGDDTLVGGKGADILSGGTGNDTLNGGYGSDTYLFNMGDGKDYISEGSSNAGDIDTLRFGEGINPEDVILQRKITTGLKAADSLVITFRDSADSITIDNFFREGKYQVEELVFANGTVWDVNTVKAMSLHGTDDAQTITAYAEGSEIHAAGGNDALQGADNSDQLYGDAGDDSLIGGKGADILSGGTGNDTLKGGYGSDTYLFNAGDGKDYLYEGTSNAGDADTLRFGEGINPEDVIIQRRKTSGLNARDSLIITFRNSTDSITLDDFFRAAKYQVEHITFADGTDWLPEDILNYLEDDIPLPIAAPPDTPVSMSLLRQEMAAFSGGEYDDEAGVVVNTTLATARTTVNSLVSY